jgi:hypothetical protein
LETKRSLFVLFFGEPACGEKLVREQFHGGSLAKTISWGSLFQKEIQKKIQKKKKKTASSHPSNYKNKRTHTTHTMILAMIVAGESKKRKVKHPQTHTTCP